MSNITTWEGIIERDMDARTTRKWYTLADSKKDAENKLKDQVKKDYPDCYWIKVTDVKISKGEYGNKN